MSNLNTTSSSIDILQDAQLAAAIQELATDGGKGLTSYLQKQQDALYSGIESDKNNTMTKAYGDLERASSAHNSLFYYDQRNTDLDNIQTDVYMNRKAEENAIVNDRDLAKRQYEINQWTAGNGMDTLFVYQQLLIIVCTVIVLLFVWRQSIISDIMFFGLLFVLVCIFIFTIVNRAQYTNFLRDKRFWNRRLFPKYRGVPMNICKDGSPNTDGVTQAVSDTIDSAGDKINDISERASKAWDDLFN